MSIRTLIPLLVSCLSLTVQAQETMEHEPQVVEHEQVAFPDSIPPGGYSGITWLGGDRYAVVSDNGRDGYFIFRITLDSVGMVTSAACADFIGSQASNPDNEDIAWFAPDSTLFISSESDTKVREFSLKGMPTGRTLPLPDVFRGTSRAYSLEALTYNAVTHRFWTTSESTLEGDGLRADPDNGARNQLRIQSFDDSLCAGVQYLYEMDEPMAQVMPERFAMGVSAMTALDDGRLLVLEREFAVPESVIGAFVSCRIYQVCPDREEPLLPSESIAGRQPMEKTLIAEWMTAVGLLDVSIANYEGMCAGPRLADGRQVIVLISDSQNQYAGVLKDWVKTIVIE